ncbi:hypothetical protein HMPREF7215_1868 [Pyramidobacter piscolens W5455]|uniref:Uncharacterized protein n=1 Tax=Pyramidobacter piscolens W5455 TaxID=352165 RepID=A0ABM9ZUK6_9BACT|nr:hypothetical protein HMPREF7215_1868 [Pyramidobacter piscolens W5455]
MNVFNENPYCFCIIAKKFQTIYIIKYITTPLTRTLLVIKAVINSCLFDQ